MSNLLWGKRRVRSSRHVREKRQRYIMFGALFLSWGLAFAVVLGLLSAKPEMSIRKIDVSGNTFVPTSEVVGKTNEVLSGAYGYLFSRRNALIFPRAELRAALLHAFPAIESVSLHVSRLSSLSIEITERVPFAIWCDGSGEVANTSGHLECYFLDQTGIIFTPSPDFSSPTYFEFKGGLSSSTPLGQHLFPPDRFKEISFFLQALRSAGVTPVSLTVEEAAGGVSDLSLQLENGARFLLSSARSLNETLDNIVTLLHDPDIAAQGDTFLKKIDYIDFRFGNKIYYKTRSE